MDFEELRTGGIARLVGTADVSLRDCFHMTGGERSDGSVDTAVVEVCVTQHLAGVGIAYFVFVENPLSGL